MEWHPEHLESDIPHPLSYCQTLRLHTHTALLQAPKHSLSHPTPIDTIPQSTHPLPASHAPENRTHPITRAAQPACLRPSTSSPNARPITRPGPTSPGATFSLCPGWPGSLLLLHGRAWRSRNGRSLHPHPTTSNVGRFGTVRCASAERRGRAGGSGATAGRIRWVGLGVREVVGWGGWRPVGRDLGVELSFGLGILEARV